MCSKSTASAKSSTKKRRETECSPAAGRYGAAADPGPIGSDQRRADMLWTAHMTRTTASRSGRHVRVHAGPRIVDPRQNCTATRGYTDRRSSQRSPWWYGHSPRGSGGMRGQRGMEVARVSDDHSVCRRDSSCQTDHVSVKGRQRQDVSQVSLSACGGL